MHTTSHLLTASSLWWNNPRCNISNSWDGPLRWNGTTWTKWSRWKTKSFLLINLHTDQTNPHQIHIILEKVCYSINNLKQLLDGHNPLFGHGGEPKRTVMRKSHGWESTLKHHISAEKYYTFNFKTKSFVSTVTSCPSPHNTLWSYYHLFLPSSSVSVAGWAPLDSIACPAVTRYQVSASPRLPAAPSASSLLPQSPLSLSPPLLLPGHRHHRRPGHWNCHWTVSRRHCQEDNCVQLLQNVD